MCFLFGSVRYFGLFEVGMFAAVGRRVVLTVDQLGDDHMYVRIL